MLTASRPLSLCISAASFDQNLWRGANAMIDSYVTARSNVASCALADGAALMDLQTGTYFSLNRVACFIWEQIQTATSITAICEQVSDHFKVSLLDCRADVEGLLAELATLGLIEVGPTP